MVVCIAHTSHSKNEVGKFKWLFTMNYGLRKWSTHLLKVRQVTNGGAGLKLIQPENHVQLCLFLSCFVTRVLALSTRVPALACSALTPMHFFRVCILVDMLIIVYPDLDSGGLYWNRENALE